MALTRKMLSAMDIDGAKIDEIINAHMDTVNALKEERDSLKAKADKSDEYQKELETAQKELDKLKDGDLQGKYDALSKEYEGFKTQVENEKTRASKEAAFKEVLKDVGITEEKNIAKVLKYYKVDELELDDKGKLANAKDIAKNVKEEWSNEITTKSTQGASVANPPANNGTGGKKTKEEILAIKDRGERQKAIAENHELFGF